MNKHFVSPNAHAIPNLTNKVIRLFCHKIIIQQRFYFPRIPNEYKTALLWCGVFLNLEPQDRFWLPWLKFVMTLSNNSRLML
jgi:hypothetical protein